MLADDLNANRADDLSIGRFNHLKFGQPLFQSIRRQPHGFPKRPQTLKIVRGGAANSKMGRTHAGSQIGPTMTESQNRCKNYNH